MVITEDGNVYGWGNNSHGQVGIESNADQKSSDDGLLLVIHEPCKVLFPDDCHEIQKISCGRKHSLAIVTKVNGKYENESTRRLSTVFGWGDKNVLCQVIAVGTPKELTPIIDLCDEQNDIFVKRDGLTPF